MYLKAIILALASLAVGAASAQTVNLVKNGDFEQTSNGPNKELRYQTVVTGWNSTGYNFVYAQGAADTIGATTTTPGTILKLWGPGTGSDNGLTSSPTGGNFIAADGGYEVSPISQTINGLVVGQQYVVGFDWAAAQQSGFTGATSENWTVSLGAEKYTTATVQNASHGFVPWMHEAMTFTATGASQVLSFLAQGTPTGQPPFSLLDNVTMMAAVSPVPEPSSWAMMAGGLGLLGFMARRKRAAKQA
jgi:hypothetical protein